MRMRVNNIKLLLLIRIIIKKKIQETIKVEISEEKLLLSVDKRFWLSPMGLIRKKILRKSTIKVET